MNEPWTNNNDGNSTQARQHAIRTHEFVIIAVVVILDLAIAALFFSIDCALIVE